MPAIHDGPATPHFRPLPFAGRHDPADLAHASLSAEMQAVAPAAPHGACVGWGIPFEVERVLILEHDPIALALPPTRTEWLVFVHTSDRFDLPWNAQGLIPASRGTGRLSEHAADYVVRYADGSEARIAIRRRHQIGAFQRMWGENCFEAVAQHKPRPVRAHHEQATSDWGRSQTRARSNDGGDWVNWLYAWQNPHPEKTVVGLRLEPVSGTIVLSAVSCGAASELPLRWRPRRKALIRLSEPFDPTMDDEGLLRQIQLDLGQVISATPQPLYPNDAWAESYNNQVPTCAGDQILVEYSAHPDAFFHLPGGALLPVAAVEHGVEHGAADGAQPVAPATQRVTLRVVEQGSSRPVAVKLHLHGAAGEYLAPVDRHRIPNHAWFEDYSADFSHLARHYATYIPGETVVDLPLGPVYVEVSKGFEIRPVRKVLDVMPDTDVVTIEIERVLPWRAQGWVTADTHVHFLSPMTALLEGAAEGVNVVNLLASQWGELMTNVGDFDGRTTWGSPEAGGDGEWLVRVGTENRQHILGHISLLGYAGPIIAPMTTGGPDESALGDPIEILLTEWARQCRQQGGLVVLPHFPNPRAEHAASIVEGEIDGIEMTSWGDLYSGINPYSLSDWYRYLNCGYAVPAVGGTDKMSASTAVGTVRTYARLQPGEPFTYAGWMNAVRRGETFVTYGPLIEFSVDGQPMGGRLQMAASGGTVDVTWRASSVTVPISRVELVVNGEIRESVAAGPGVASGHWAVRLERSAWLALLVRGCYADKPEIIAAHSSPVMVALAGSPFYAAADAVTILEQIEGALAYLDTVGVRAEDRVYRRMRLVIEAAHRRLHNRMHQQGHYHSHSPTEDHRAHH
ncbi:MAG: CehA/McbA family metallohydrolase [Chloroflexota bacterium]